MGLRMGVTGVVREGARARTVLAVSALVAGLLGAATQVASASGSDAGRLLSLTNSSRRSNGLAALASSASLASSAQRHSDAMAASGRAYHSSSMYGAAAENVARVRSVDEAHRLFMQSPTHRVNILDPQFTSIGIGVAYRSGWVYVTELFARSGVRRVAPKAVSRSAAPRRVAPKPVVRPVVVPVSVARPRTIDVLLEVVRLDARIETS